MLMSSVTKNASGEAATLVSCTSFNNKPSKLSIKPYVYISKDSINTLSEFCIKEYWGHNNCHLFKYLDYTWQTQLINNMVKIFEYNGNKKLLFHSGLYERKSFEPVYIICHKNTQKRNKDSSQKWRTNIDSFLTKASLFNKYGLIASQLPKQTFIDSNIEKYNPNYSLTINIHEKARTAKQKIARQFGVKEISLDYLEYNISKAVNSSLNMLKSNPSLIGKQVYMNNKKEFSIELLLPILLRYGNKTEWFAMVLKPNDAKHTYNVVSIINKNTAYINSRILGPVQAPWLMYNDYTYITKSSSSQSSLNEAKPNKINNVDINQLQFDISTQNPFFFIATILPLRLPKLNVC